jgi:D-alanyl-D-alanine carboxypeptidase
MIATRTSPRSMLAAVLVLVLVVSLVAAPAAVAQSPTPTASADTGERWTGAPLPAAEMSADDAEAIDAVAAALLDRVGNEFSGLWLGVWDPAKGVHIAAYGDAAFGGPTATVDDKGRIGSITKTFTATAILRLVADGALSLDDTVAEVLPDLAAELPEIAGVTVEQLLAMRSGIPEYEARVVPQVLAHPDTPIEAHDIIVSTVREQGVAPPGTPGYSTTNYSILGEMLTALTGQTPQEVLDALAAEVGLTDTALPAVGDGVLPAPASAGYVNDNATADLRRQGIDVEKLGDVSTYDPSWGGAGGAMYSTVEDLGRWAATGFGTSLLPRDLGERRLASEPIAEGLRYGLGIIDYDDGFYGHIGEILGWESFVAYDPKTGAALTLIVNESGSLGAAAGVIIAAFPDLANVFGL